MKILAALRKDGYKVGHVKQYPADTTLVYSNYTPRKSRIEDSDGMIAFGIQGFIKEVLIDYWNQNFFWWPRDAVMKEYAKRIDNYLGPGMNYDHIGKLWDLRYLPIEIKCVPEGTIVPFRVPVFTIKNTLPEFYWVTNMIETDISNGVWHPMTSATTALRYRRVFEKYAKLTGADPSFVKWQGHDFSYRGLYSLDGAASSGAGHLLCFTGTDTIPAIDYLEQFYGADCEKELIGGSVPATEHSVMCMGGKQDELATIKRLITEVHPTGIVSIVSDTWNLWDVLTKYLPQLRSIIINRTGKVVIRPDSGDPVKIICGDPASDEGRAKLGVIQLLWYWFGGTTNAAGYKVLDPHVGCIYGDSITPERQVAILEGLKNLGFASSNVVLGVGSYTYQYVTRDTYGQAFKATYGEVGGVGYPIYKDPVTDDGTKKSATGLLKVYHNPVGKVEVMENVDWNAEQTGLLQTIFKDGKQFNIQTLAQIRALVESQI